MTTSNSAKNLSTENFIEAIVQQDLAKNPQLKLHFRFPPEPNGFLHLGHAKAICLNFTLAKKYGGKVNLRFDDTNPDTEKDRYTEAIKADIAWLGFQWDEEHYASDYFTKLYEWAHLLIDKGLAYVDDASMEEIARLRGDLQNPGIDSPCRTRTIAENKALFTAMREGKFPEGTKVLRAKINMQSPNVQLRDPVIYRIKYTPHHRTGKQWCIYPMYDYAHGQSDSIEQITHSLCSLEYVLHRPLYDWFIQALGIFPSRQYEFARLNLSHTLMSKRKLLALISQGLVRDWDDPRMPTLRGLRRRGYTPRAIRNFCEAIGVAKRDNIIELSRLEHYVREDLNKIAIRVMCVFNPVRLIISNWPQAEQQLLRAEKNPEDPEAGFRDITFSHELFIEREDFLENPPKGYHRFSPKQCVRLKYAYIIKFQKLSYDAQGQIDTIYAEYVPNSKSGEDSSGLKVKATIHWVDAQNAVPVELRLYEPLFAEIDPSRSSKQLSELVNPNSLKICENAQAEAILAQAQSNTHYQFLRQGYFFLDQDSTDSHKVFNRTVSLKAPKW